MTVAELIAELARFPPDLMVVHSTGMMQDREEVTSVRRGDPSHVAWTRDVNRCGDGQWVEVI